MKRIITLASGQFGDLSLEKLCELAGRLGYDGLELATHAHLDVDKVIESDTYVEEVKATLGKYNLTCQALSAHLAGQCVGDRWDPRLDHFAPEAYSGQPEKIREWAIDEMKKTALAAKRLGVSVVTGFMGSPIWAYWYSYPQTTKEMVREGFDEIYRLFSNIIRIQDYFISSRTNEETIIYKRLFRIEVKRWRCIRQRLHSTTILPEDFLTDSEGGRRLESILTQATLYGRG